MGITENAQQERFETYIQAIKALINIAESLKQERTKLYKKLIVSFVNTFIWGAPWVIAVWSFGWPAETAVRWCAFPMLVSLFIQIIAVLLLYVIQAIALKSIEKHTTTAAEALFRVYPTFKQPKPEWTAEIVEIHNKVYKE